MLIIGEILIHIMKSCNLEVLLLEEQKHQILSALMCPKEDVVDGLEFLREEIVPVLPESIKITSFLLLKSLTPWNPAVVSNEAFKGLNTVLISRVSELKDMSDAERLNMKGAICHACFRLYGRVGCILSGNPQLLHGEFIRLCRLVFLQ